MAELPTNENIYYFILDKDESRLQKVLECGIVVVKDKDCI